MRWLTDDMINMDVAFLSQSRRVLEWDGHAKTQFWEKSYLKIQERYPCMTGF